MKLSRNRIKFSRLFVHFQLFEKVFIRFDFLNCLVKIKIAILSICFHNLSKIVICFNHFFRLSQFLLVPLILLNLRFPSWFSSWWAFQSWRNHVFPQVWFLYCKMKLKHTTKFQEVWGNKSYWFWFFSFFIPILISILVSISDQMFDSNFHFQI